MLPFLAFALKNWRVVSYAALALVVVGFLWSWHERGMEVERQAQRIAIQQADLKAKDTELTIAHDAAAAADAKYRIAQSTNAAIQKLIGEIQHAASTADGPVAPVLRDALAGISRLRQPADADKGRRP